MRAGWLTCTGQGSAFQAYLTMTASGERFDGWRKPASGILLEKRNNSQYWEQEKECVCKVPLLAKLAQLLECQEARLWLRPLIPVALMTFLSQDGFEDGWEERGTTCILSLWSTLYLCCWGNGAQGGPAPLTLTQAVPVWGLTDAGDRHRQALPSRMPVLLPEVPSLGSHQNSCHA